MFKLVSRSKSMRSLRAFGGGATKRAEDVDQDVAGIPARHGPDSPLLGHDHLPGPASVSDPPRTPTKPDSALNTAAPQPSPPVSTPSRSPTTAADDGSIAYARRPLPQPPSRSPDSKSTRQPAPQRPSTSAGPSVSPDNMDSEYAARRPNLASKRMSKDDMYINTQSTKSFRSYHIPIRGKPPSPNDSPRSRTPDPTIPVRTQTPDSMMDGNYPPEPIGMALGSPGLPPTTASASQANWQPQLAVTRSRAPWDEPPETMPTKKSGKWRLFGLFGGKKNDSRERTATPEWTGTPVTDSPRPVPGDREELDFGRSNTTGVKRNKKVNPIIIRSQTEPAIETPTSTYLMEPKTPKTPKAPKTPKFSKSPSLSRKASTKSLREGIRKADISAPVLAAPQMPPMPSLPGSYLDVEIPDVKMERYSIMFNGILHPKSSDARNSIHARRQATLKRLQSIQDAIEEEEARKAAGMPGVPAMPAMVVAADMGNTTAARPSTSAGPSSRQHAKSPSFSLFPVPPTTAAPNAGLGIAPLPRSSTSPAALPSPLRGKFELMDPPGPRPELPPPLAAETARVMTPEQRTRSQMSQQSQDIPILLEGDMNRGREGIPRPSTSSSASTVRANQRSFSTDRARSTSRSRAVQQLDQARQAREAPQARQVAQGPMPAALTISKVPRPTAQADRARQQTQEQNQGATTRSRSRSQSRIPQPTTTQQQQQPQKQQQPQASAQPPTTFRPGQSALILDSPTDDVSGQSRMPGEPAWQIISPPSSSTASSSGGSTRGKRSPSSASSVLTHMTKPSIEEPDAGFKSAVEISIARQISLSRQQQSLLQQPGRARPWKRADVTPVGVGSTARAAASTRKAVAAGAGAGAGERLVQTKAARPMYIQPGFSTDPKSPENRKSERVVLEGM